jgi:hypothetical protein
MAHKLRKIVASVAVLGAVAVGASAVAGAASNGSGSQGQSTQPGGGNAQPGTRGAQPPPPGRMGGHPGETPLQGDTAAKVRKVALETVPGGTILRVETDAEGSPYEAHVRKADGSEVTVKVSKQFEATRVERFGGPGPRGQWPGGPPPSGSSPGGSGTAPGAGYGTAPGAAGAGGYPPAIAG